MAQADGNVANASGATFRADLNSQLLALFTQHSGNAAPSSPQAFQPWIDTSTTPATWKVRNSGNTAWITIGTLNSTSNTFSVGGVTAIASGGTGQTSASAAINALVPSQTDNSGKSLITNGTAVSWGSSGSGRLLRAPQILRSGTSYTTPADCASIYVECVGGGGGGDTGDTVENFGGGGGGAGAYCAKLFTVTASTSYTYAIGAGGAAQGAGGNTTFTVGGTTITAGGGGAASGDFTAGLGGTATNGDINVDGNDGSPGATANSSTPEGVTGTGGGSFFGGGGRGGAAGTSGGGGGGGLSSAPSVGAGGAGLIRITEYS